MVRNVRFQYLMAGNWKKKKKKHWPIRLEFVNCGKHSLVFWAICIRQSAWWTNLESTVMLFSLCLLGVCEHCLHKDSFPHKGLNPDQHEIPSPPAPRTLANTALVTWAPGKGWMKRTQTNRAESQKVLSFVWRFESSQCLGLDAVSSMCSRRLILRSLLLARSMWTRASVSKQNLTNLTRMSLVIMTFPTRLVWPQLPYSGMDSPVAFQWFLNPLKVYSIVFYVHICKAKLCWIPAVHIPTYMPSIIWLTVYIWPS